MTASSQRSTPTALSIAGSDSGGGAGIQADLKAFARCGVHGMTAVTAITWQNTVSVSGVTPVDPEAIVGQVKAVAEDIGVDAAKVGMLGSAKIAQVVADALDLLGNAPLVIDPVMVSESGARLLDEDATSALIELLGRATVVTPNLAEARALAERAGATTASPAELARAIATFGPRCVVVTGGHLDGRQVVDTFWDGEQLVEIPGPRHPGGAAHGSGCTHSAALAAHLALGFDPLEAARAAKRIAADAVRHGLVDVGSGAGPVDALASLRRAQTSKRLDGE